ncbi:MAG: ferredoxin family protein [Myxococcales bacterium]|jgi:2-oxoglutarate ferredoxin oxidoreductase subunit delta|nr:ferredoxin family protein [Myxococcales bacterium]
MNRVAIDQDRCKACRLCIGACRFELLALGKDLNAKGYHPVEVLDASKCVACAQCATLCPEGAIAVYRGVK